MGRLRGSLAQMDRGNWIALGILVALVAAYLTAAAVFGQNPFRQPDKATQVEWFISTFQIDRKGWIDQEDLGNLRLFFSSSVLAELWDIAEAAGGSITDWADIKDATDKITTSDLYRLSVFYELTGRIEEE